MELNVEKPTTVVAKVTFTVPAAELRAELDKGLRSVGQNVRMKGFRPGKVPRKVLEKAYGANVRQEVIGKLVNRAYQRAVTEHELRPLAHPHLSDEHLKDGPDGSLSAEFEVALRPDFELPNYLGRVVTSELEPVMDQQIDAALEEFRDSQSTPEPAGEAGLAEKGFFLGDVVFLHEDATVFEREGIRLSVQSAPPGVEPELFKSTLIGTQNDAVHEFDMTLPNYLEDETKRGQPGVCRVTIKETFNLAPPTEEKLCELLEVPDMPALREKVREKLSEAATAREEQRIESAILDMVLEETHIELPEPIIEQQTAARLEQFKQKLEEKGMGEEDLQVQLEGQKATSREEATKGLKALLVVEELGRKEELLVTQDEVRTELKTIAERNQASMEDVHKFYSEGGRGQQLMIELLERKVRKFLREKADIQAPA